MNKGYTMFAKGIGVGMAAGMAVYCAAQKASKKNCLAKRTSKAVHALGDMVDNVQAMFKG